MSTAASSGNASSSSSTATSSSSHPFSSPSPKAPSDAPSLSAFEQWRRKAALITGVGVTPEERAADQMSIHCNGCEQWKSQLLQYSPSVLFMLKHLKLSGCEVPPDNIICAPCGPPPGPSITTTSPSASSTSASAPASSSARPNSSQSATLPTAKSGGFSPEAGAIVLCAGQFFSKAHMENTLVHELVHMYDHCRFKVDWNDLRHHACSEACVRRRAVLSVASNPACPDAATAERAVNEVWDSCFSDTRPFDEIY
ncbi:hypothetical protein HGRIS_008803 [Hohenbuehelia grisea]|uniref:Mitochondrial inner membrane protease ATP23 n=1 Tax=Hohenbuehelia grisea TaxID=104357 RepID=A0ABR3J9Q9_9AGAR